MHFFSLARKTGYAGAPGHPGPKGEPGKSISAPEVIVSPASLTVTQSQTATFVCSADGNPEPSVSWRKISGEDKENTGDEHSTLQIKNATYNDSGKYVCIARNVLGQDQKEVELLVEGKLLFWSIFSEGKETQKHIGAGNSIR